MAKVRFVRRLGGPERARVRVVEVDPFFNTFTEKNSELVKQQGEQKAVMRLAITWDARTDPNYVCGTRSRFP